MNKIVIFYVIPKTFPRHIQAPKGLLGRGKYKVNSALTDDQEIAHKEWNWTLQITKNWDSDE